MPQPYKFQPVGLWLDKGRLECDKCQALATVVVLTTEVNSFTLYKYCGECFFRTAPVYQQPTPAPNNEQNNEHF